MVYGIYQSAAGMQLNQYRQDVLANNLANVATPGFKPDITVVRERPQAAQENLTDPALTAVHLRGLSGGSLVAPTYTSFVPGPIEKTGNPMDVALPGGTFLAVRDGNTTRYTRDGRLTIDERGQVVTVSGGMPVLGAGGAPITLTAQAAGEARIDVNGDVRSGRQTFGQLGLVRFADTGSLRKSGGNLLEAFDRPIPVEGQFQTGAIEGSAVDPTQSMVSMIEVTRAYQMNATLAGLADSTLGRAVNDIARLR